MKKFIYNISLLAALFLVVTACTKEDSLLDSFAVEKEQPVSNNTYTMTVNASKGEDVATTRGLALDGKKLKSTWKVGETVKVYNSSSEELGTLTAQSNGASTTLSGTLTGTIAVDNVLTLKFCSPNYASQAGTLEYIETNCDYATASVTVSSVDGGNVTTDAAHFVNQQAIVKFTLKDKADDGATSLSASKLVVTVGANSYTITPASANNELFVAIPGFSGQSITLNAIVGSKVYTYTKSGVTFTNSQYYTRGVQMTHQGTIEIGKLIGQNGCIYANAAAATSAGTTAAGMIAYIGSASNCTNGLAIALADDGDKSLEGATNAAAAKNRSTGLPVVGGTWRVPTKADWEHMLTACGDSYDGANWTTSGLRGKLQTVYADIVMGNSYWANTPYPYSSGNSYRLYNGDPSGASFQYQSTTESIKVRAVLAF